MHFLLAEILPEDKDQPNANLQDLKSEALWLPTTEEAKAQLAQRSFY